MLPLPGRGYDKLWGYIKPSIDGSPRRRQVESELCRTPDGPTILKSRVSDSARPTDRPAARSAAKQIWGSEHPTDRPSLQAAQPFVQVIQ